MMKVQCTTDRNTIHSKDPIPCLAFLLFLFSYIFETWLMISNTDFKFLLKSAVRTCFSNINFSKYKICLPEEYHEIRLTAIGLQQMLLVWFIGKPRMTRIGVLDPLGTPLQTQQLALNKAVISFLLFMNLETICSFNCFFFLFSFLQMKTHS